MVSFTSKFAMLAAFAFAISGANAKAVSTLSNFTIEACGPSPEDVWDPAILIPNANTVWSAGQTVNVTWNTANPPSDISNYALITLLGAAEQFGPSILAEGFSLLTGYQEITIPTDTPSGDDFFITLFGDSGNSSPQFKIVGN